MEDYVDSNQERSLERVEEYNIRKMEALARAQGWWLVDVGRGQTRNKTETQTHNRNRSQTHNETETPTHNQTRSQTHNETETQTHIRTRRQTHNESETQTHKTETWISCHAETSSENFRTSTRPAIFQRYRRSRITGSSSGSTLRIPSNISNIFFHMPSSRTDARTDQWNRVWESNEPLRHAPMLIEAVQKGLGFRSHATRPSLQVELPATPSQWATRDWPLICITGSTGEKANRSTRRDRRRLTNKFSDLSPVVFVRLKSTSVRVIFLACHVFLTGGS
ncbi:unnamed protein product [Nesidiocoris tenuis]|uniref:Uncharacterized protein n=1 Tax=Nesidiocoris tenuis TaxID=355587 RepID=A0A6H5GXY0_9HEMI|nr:unnamed protein product [Nesidiocoris tenuis]